MGNLYTYTSYTIIEHIDPRWQYLGIFRNITCIYRKINPQKTIITTDLLTGVEVSRLSNIKTSLEMIRLRNFRNLHNIKKETIQKPINRHAQNFYIVLARAQSYFSKNTKKLIRQMT